MAVFYKLPFTQKTLLHIFKQEYLSFYHNITPVNVTWLNSQLDSNQFFKNKNYSTSMSTTCYSHFAHHDKFPFGLLPVVNISLFTQVYLAWLSIPSHMTTWAQIQLNLIIKKMLTNWILLNWLRILFKFVLTIERFLVLQ